jgi:hypothetical protein
MNATFRLGTFFDTNISPVRHTKYKFIPFFDFLIHIHQNLHYKYN